MKLSTSTNMVFERINMEPISRSAESFSVSRRDTGYSISASMT